MFYVCHFLADLYVLADGWLYLTSLVYVYTWSQRCMRSTIEQQWSFIVSDSKESKQ